MKNSIIPFLLFISFSLFAQDAQDVNARENDDTRFSATELQSTPMSNDDVVFNSIEESSTYERRVRRDENSFDTYLGEISEDGELIINNKLHKDPNLKKHNGMLTYSKDGKTVFFSVNRKIKDKKGKGDKEVKTKSTVNLQLFRASVDDDGEWFNLEMLPFNSNHFSTGQPVLNEDDSKLYFVSDGPESMGRTDIFVVDLNQDGTYGKPVNLGPTVNTEERDIFPFIDKGNVLFFASDAHNGQGELDVFVCRIFDNSISTPMKLKVPLNTGEDAASNTVNDFSNGYFSSNRQVGKGDNDIYAFAASIPIVIDCQQEVIGIVKDQDTQELLPNLELILFDAEERRLDSFLSGKTDATFSFKQSCNTTYTLKGYSDGKLIGEQEVKTVNDLNAEPMKIVMNMDLDLASKDDFIAEVVEPDDNSVNTYYNFNSNRKVFTVQIGAFRENAQPDNSILINNVFSHVYADGYNRFYSGVFESSIEARKYLELIKEKGYSDAFIVGLNGESRF